MNRSLRALLCLLAAVALLGGCGNKGDLVLPDPPAEERPDAP